MTERDERWVLHTPAGDRRAWAGARQLWVGRELVVFFAVRDVQLRYRQAALGILWVVAQPIAIVLVLTAVFSAGAGVRTGEIPYPLFALVGLLSWSYFSTSVTRGSESLVADAALVTKVHFPRLAVPVAALVPGLLDLLVGLALFGVLSVAFQVSPSWRLVLLPVWLLMMVTFSLGLTLWLAALNVRYRDVRNAVGPVLQVLLFASPVAYPSDLIKGRLQLVYEANPMNGIISLGRFVFLDTPLATRPVLFAVGWTVVAFVGGFRYFQRAERTFADVI